MLTVRRTAFSVALYPSLPATFLHVTLPAHEHDTSSSTFVMVSFLCVLDTHTISRIAGPWPCGRPALSARTLGRLWRLFYIMHEDEDGVSGVRPLFSAARTAPARHCFADGAWDRRERKICSQAMSQAAACQYAAVEADPA